MPKAISAVYAALLLEPNLSAEHQRRIFTYAKARRDEELLDALLMHPALIEEIDAELGENLTDYKARARWFKRPGRSVDKIEEFIKGEKSLTVLTSLASQDLPPAAFRLLAERNGVKLAQALLTNSRTPSDARVKAARNWAASFRLGNLEKALSQVRQTLTGSPAELEAALEVAKSPVLLTALAGYSGLSAEFYETLVSKASAMLDEEIEEPPTTPVAYGDMFSYPNLRPANSYWGTSPSTSSKKYVTFDVFMMLGHHKTLPGSVKDSIRAKMNSFKPRASKTKLTGVGKKLTSPVSSPGNHVVIKHQSEAVLRVLSTRSNSSIVQPFALKERLKVAASRGWMDVVECLSHPDATVRMASTKVNAYWHVNPQFIKALKNLDFKILVAFLAANPVLVNDRNLLGIGRPVEMTLSLLRLHDHVNRNALAAGLLHSKFLTREALLELPARYLAAPSIPLYVHQLVGQLLAEHLGEERGAWEIFESLSDEFEGTFAELLAASDALA